MEQLTKTHSDFSRLHEIGTEAAPVMCSLVNMFFEQSPALIEALATDIQNQNMEQGKKSAHTLKGVCANLGLNTLADQAKLIELTIVDGEMLKAQSQLKELKLLVAQTDDILQELINHYSA